MTSTVSLEGIQQAVFYPFKGEKWGLKLLIGTLLTFAGFIVPIVPILPVYGYIGKMMHAIIVDEADPRLPEWNDWGNLFIGGLKLFGAGLVYMLPALIVTIGGYAIFMALDISMVLTTNAVRYSSNAFPTPVLLSVFGMFGGLLVMLLGMVLMLLTVIFIPPALGNLIAKDEFGAAFRIRDWWPVLKANLPGYVIAVMLSLGAFYLLYFLVFLFYATVVLCFILPLLLAFIGFLCGMLALGLFAIAYRDGLKKAALTV